MLYNIKNNRLKFWEEFDELGSRAKFDLVHYPCFCGCAKSKLISNVSRHRNAFDFVQCQNCGTVRIDPYLTDQGIADYYRQIYGSIKRKGVPAERLFKRQKKSSKLIHSQVAPLINKDAKILDFGAGTGGKMAELLAQGFDVSIKEVDETYFNYGLAQGFKAFDAAQKYNLISLGRVLEHMNHPHEFLQDLVAKHLAPNGLLYIEVPLMENAKNNSLLAELHVSHKWYFSMQSFKLAVGMAGLKAVYQSRNLLIVTPTKSLELPTKRQLMRASNQIIRKNRTRKLLGYFKNKNAAPK